MLLNSDQVLQYVTNVHKIKQKQQVSVDLTVKHINKIQGGYISNDSTQLYDYEEVELVNGVFHLKRGSYSMTFNEGLTPLPPSLTAFITHRSSLLRMGGMISSGIFDPGFYTANLGACLMIFNDDIKIEINSRVATIFITENIPTQNIYNGQWQGVLDKK